MRSWRACPLTVDGKHEWVPMAQSHILTRRYELNFKRKVLSVVDFRVQCMHCLFSTTAQIDFRNKELRVRA